MRGVGSTLSRLGFHPADYPRGVRYVGLCGLLALGVYALEARLEPGENGVTVASPQPTTGAR